MISIFALFAIFASCIYVILAIFVYFINHKETLNRIFIFTGFFGTYTAFTTLMVIQADNIDSAQLWNKVGFLWPFFNALIFQFIMVFTENRISRSKKRFFILYLPAAIFSILDLATDYISGGIIKDSWGYTFAGSNLLSSLACTIWSASLAFFAILTIVRYYFRINNRNKKQQTRLITIGISIPVALNFLSKIALPLFGWDIPYYGVGANAILCTFIVYAIWKYGLFNLNPAMAAENIIGTMPDSFILTDPEGKIIRINQALTGLTNFKENELSGRHISGLLTDETSAIAKLVEKQELRSYETKIRTKNNILKPISISASPIKSKKGAVLGITIIIHDLTILKEMEEKVIKNERFAAIGELAGMIGHDLRNPLTSIQVATYYLKRKDAKDMEEPSRQMLDTIEKSIKYSNKIVNDLLEYSVEIKIKPEITNIRALTINALELISIPKNIKLVNLTEDSPTLQADIDKLTRVFINIIKNAYEAMPNGGILTIRNIKTQGNIEVSFEDTGTGMAPETIEKLWTPLFTTKAKGMGFGLPICKRIIEAHAGKIQVNSSPKKGTNFIITIPKNHP